MLKISSVKAEQKQVVVGVLNTDAWLSGSAVEVLADKIYVGSIIISPYDSDMPGVEPLDNTPDNIDRRLASVLDIKSQLLRQLSPLADAEDISP